jgi:hypothetical protein
LEYGFSASNSDSLGEASSLGDADPDAIALLFFRAFADFILLRTGAALSLSQLVNVLVVG